MRVGTDAVLLASWADLNDTKRILDVGTGTGVIALMCTQRNQNVLVEAIEIHEGSAEDARLNFEISPWKNRLRLHTGDFLKIVHRERQTGMWRRYNKEGIKIDSLVYDDGTE